MAARIVPNMALEDQENFHAKRGPLRSPTRMEMNTITLPIKTGPGLRWARQYDYELQLRCSLLLWGGVPPFYAIFMTLAVSPLQDLKLRRYFHRSNGARRGHFWSSDGARFPLQGARFDCRTVLF